MVDEIQSCGWPNKQLRRIVDIIFEVFPGMLSITHVLKNEKKIIQRPKFGYTLKMFPRHIN